MQRRWPSWRRASRAARQQAAAPQPLSCLTESSLKSGTPLRYGISGAMVRRRATPHEADPQQRACRGVRGLPITAHEHARAVVLPGRASGSRCSARPHHLVSDLIVAMVSGVAVGAGRWNGELRHLFERALRTMWVHTLVACFPSRSRATWSGASLLCNPAPSCVFYRHRLYCRPGRSG